VNKSILSDLIFYEEYKKCMENGEAILMMQNEMQLTKEEVKSRLQKSDISFKIETVFGFTPSEGLIEQFITECAPEPSYITCDEFEHSETIASGVHTRVGEPLLLCDNWASIPQKGDPEKEKDEEYAIVSCNLGSLMNALKEAVDEAVVEEERQIKARLCGNRKQRRANFCVTHLEDEVSNSFRRQTHHFMNGGKRW
jgi:hypothetical protein